MDLFKNNDENQYSIIAKSISTGSCLHKRRQLNRLATDSVKSPQAHFHQSEIPRHDENDCATSNSSRSYSSICNDVDHNSIRKSTNSPSKVDLFLYMSDHKNRLKYYKFEDLISDLGDLETNKPPSTPNVIENNNELSRNITRQTRLSTEAHPYMLFLDLLDDEDFDED
ncbi:hypothetical protein ACHAXS_001635 [Conticribra weissflogii]